MRTGRYQEPLIPDNIESLMNFAGKLEHSISYRHPSTYLGQRVAVLGSGSSGEELSREISSTAQRVFVCAHQNSRAFFPQEEGIYGERRNISRHREIHACQGRDIVLACGERLTDIDTLLLCTGFRVSNTLLSLFPGAVLSGNQICITPLYLNTFHPVYPELMVFGMPMASVVNATYHCQAKLVTGYATGQFRLPSEKQRIFAAQQTELKQSGRLGGCRT